MKKIRNMLFGYELKNGKVVIAETEAEIIRQIYVMYKSGKPLTDLVKMTDMSGIPYSDASPRWDRHKIHRILADERYIGNDKYPPIINKEIFDCVREVFNSKPQTNQTVVLNPEKHIWKKLRCMKCGGRMLRSGGRMKNTVLECENCHIRVSIVADEFKEEVFNEYKKNMAGQKSNNIYTPTQEIIRLENDIMRRLEKPEDSEKTRNIILTAASKRYMACPEPTRKEQELDWQMFKEQVDTVLIRTDEITIRLKE